MDATEETLIRTYIGRPAFERERQQLQQQGWQVAHVHERRRRIGSMRVLMLRWLAWLFPPEPELVVTYQRGRSAGS